MHVTHLSLHDFRSYAALELPLSRGITTLLGSNGQGKTNVVEAIEYLGALSSHRVSNDTPLVRSGCEQAVVRATVSKADRSALLEIEINPGKANRARVNKVGLPRTRDLVGLLRTVVFSPEDLVLVKGDPSDRRRFVDHLITLRTPRLAGVRADYDKVLKQRNALLKSARNARRPDDYLLSTLAVWDEQLVSLAAELTHARCELLVALAPFLQRSYREVAAESRRQETSMAYVFSYPTAPLLAPTRHSLAEDLRAALAARQRDELERGLTLCGPHRDDVAFELGALPVKGYASHGETWSFALALRLASYQLLREEAEEPLLILDDVFAELDADRRLRLAELVQSAEQVLITAAVAADVPDFLQGAVYRVHDGAIEVMGGVDGST